ncbi:hypothetical protein PISMIDRAFT_686544 [Pisolithus microcarpus 441]|uniref:Uncharacterized protein n=1 Tax=Pisolithus microcarpus 441 TaxID=765257 RepID=A0A0C9XUY7_9AGAM|nr:hypothetical protein PISMIDRAFT_686544 [Pisolithus microcarpus 441]
MSIPFPLPVLMHAVFGLDPEYTSQIVISCCKPSFDRTVGIKRTMDPTVGLVLPGKRIWTVTRPVH